jgi:predicted 3-demethylubiquinone-9 3-methyltransferase (glyoxalase superfamily)
MQKITPFLWFDDNAEEAVNFYVSVFKDAKITNITHMSDETPGPKGKVMVLSFELEGQEFTALNGGPGVFTFTGAISLVVNCETQEEVDHYWEKLSAVPQAEQCGWLVDKYGVYWQITPTVLSELLNGSDTEKAKRVTRAMLQMKKLDIAALQNA